MRTPFLLITAVLVAFASGCEDAAETGPTPEELAMRETAWRQACAARELETIAASDIETLEATMQSLDPNDPVAEISRRASEAALGFARAFHRHAELRHRAYAALDSAANSATSTADSARYVERAGAFTIRVPDPGTVEANVIDAYVQRLSAIMEDEDHRCNWDTPF